MEVCKLNLLTYLNVTCGVCKLNRLTYLNMTCEVCKLNLLTYLNVTCGSMWIFEFLIPAICVSLKVGFK